MNILEEVAGLGYGQENPVPYLTPVEAGPHRVFIFGSCVGAVLTERRENDPHVAITYLVEDDGFWSVLSSQISAYWIDDMLDLIKFVQNYMRSSGKFKELKNGYGLEWFEWKDFEE